VSTIVSDGNGDVCGATEPKAGTGQGTVVPFEGATVVVGPPVVLGATVVEVDVVDARVELEPFESSSSPEHAAETATTSSTDAPTLPTSTLRTPAP
jgi:hypothetical protein